MTKPLRVLIVEDSVDDVILLLLALRRGGYAVEHEVVETAPAMRTALERQHWDVITSDHSMPGFSAPLALALAKELCPEVPFIIVSGEIDLNLAVSLMKESAQDYIQKRDMPRLSMVIERELREVVLRRERQQAKDELKVSEVRYRRLFETTQDGVLILDADTGQIEDVNPLLIHLLGYSKEAFLGKKLWEIGAFQDIEMSKGAFETLQRDDYVRYDDLPLVTSDQRQIAVEFVSNVYVIDEKRVAQCNIRDITARKQAEAEVHALNVQLEHHVHERTVQLETLNSELETFNYAVSHDLRAPLRRIMGFAEALREDHIDPQNTEALKYIQSICVSVERMNALIDALLELARFSRNVLKRQPVDLSAIVQEFAAELQESHLGRWVVFTIAEAITVNGDEQLLRIVLENLIRNAWKFTGQREVAHITFGATVQTDGSAVYFVQDDGAGFDMTNADKLFGTFQRFHSQKEFPGLGIGLATVQRIIHRHDGHVWAEAVVGNGATFFFTLGEAQSSYLNSNALEEPSRTLLCLKQAIAAE